MHRTLKQEATIPPAPTLRAQQKVFDRFQQVYNAERPHEALGGRTPDEVYLPSTRRVPTHLEPFEYPTTFEVRTVRSDGIALMARRRVKIGKPLAGKRVAFGWVSDTKWEIRYGPLTLGILDLRTQQMIGRRHSKRGPPFREVPVW